jgi:chemotaxis protein MotA
VFLIIGFVIVFGSILGGYVMHHGEIAVLIQVNEFIIIGGAALGSMIIGNPPGTLKRAMQQVIALLKPSPYSRAAYADLLQVLYKVFQKARKDGLMGLEAHIEAPENSDIFKQHPKFLHHHHGVSMLCDTLKVLLTGAVENHHLDDILTMDLDKQHHEATAGATAISKVSDAMPGFGIVAAVLGVVITMGSIGGSATEVGEKVAAALVGTFLGILLSYGLLSPVAQAIESRIAAEHAYMQVIKTALLAFARGDSPMSAVEFARRNIEPDERPSFSQLEELTKKQPAAA